MPKSGTCNYGNYSIQFYFIPAKIDTHNRRQIDDADLFYGAAMHCPMAGATTRAQWLNTAILTQLRLLCS